MISRPVRGMPLIMVCDGKCDKAWGVNLRPKVKLSEDPDDYIFKRDSELGLAPVNPGSYEGGDGKPSGTPISDGSRMNKWCFRECERSDRFEPGEEIVVRDLENPQPNIPR